MLNSAFVSSSKQSFSFCIVMHGGCLKFFVIWHSKDGYFMQKFLCAGKEQSKMLASVSSLYKQCFPMKGEADGSVQDHVYSDDNLTLTVVWMMASVPDYFFSVFLGGWLILFKFARAIYDLTCKYKSVCNCSAVSFKWLILKRY